MFVKVAFCLVAVLMLASFAQAQAKTVTGNYCGEEEAGDGAYYSFLVNVRNHVTDFSVSNISKVKILNSKIKNIWEIPVGSEIVVNYSVKRDKKILSSISLTGKINKNIKSCSP